MAYINKSIFRAYDIRGQESDKELNEISMELLGKAYGTYMHSKDINVVVVGHDSRATSKAFQSAAIRGLRSTGRNVIDLGIINTPMMYWAQYQFRTKGGMMITASHNPRGWNGAKFASDFSQTLGGKDLLQLYGIITKSDFYSQSKGSIKKEDIKKAYINDLVRRVSIDKRFKIVVNTGNGTAGLIEPDLLRAAGCEVIEHNTKLDSTYPNYTPNPAEIEMMEDTSRVVVKNHADLGFAFDGDGDRLGLVDEKGSVVDPDHYMIFLSRIVLRHMPGAAIVYDIKSSQALSEDIKAHGGVPIMAPTGHSNIKAKMREVNAELAGEFSGHIFFKYNYYGFDDASFAALNLLQYFSEQDKSISKLVEGIPHYISTPSYTAQTPDDKKFQVVKKIKKEFQKEGYDVNDMDGARVQFKNGWGLVRASNTSPAITLRFEAKTKGDLKKIETIFRQKLNKYDFIAKEWKAA